VLDGDVVGQHVKDRFHIDFDAGVDQFDQPRVAVEHGDLPGAETAHGTGDLRLPAIEPAGDRRDIDKVVEIAAVVGRDAVGRMLRKVVTSSAGPHCLTRDFSEVETATSMAICTNPHGSLVQDHHTSRQGEPDQSREASSPASRQNPD
jgi:hypothetical protein